MVGQFGVETAHDEANDGLRDKTGDLSQIREVRRRRQLKSYHRPLRAENVHDEGTNDRSGHVEQAAYGSEGNTTLRCENTHLMTTAQPKTTVSESLPPVMLLVIVEE